MAAEQPFDIDVVELERRRNAGEAPALLDVRESWETDICLISGSMKIPMNEVPERLEELPRDRPLVVICHHGVRSLHMTAWLRRNGFDNAINLRGGIDAWAREIDRGMSLY
ncbi:rhodanese-like domain-containing protein [Telmatospirillum sp. J64-1]|uniref:rhodanese-like domain-containing protein n=1 Tax=Telmatospirillum sp. J64-1 TaxID=2502183 RepID=UPI00115C856F|nr:rhodanese-like domain-containing protein [Telmatospirillum sp. J64-1]